MDFTDPEMDEFKGLESAGFKNISQDWLGKVDVIEARNVNLILRVAESTSDDTTTNANGATMDGFVLHVPSLRIDTSNSSAEKSLTFDTLTLGSFAGVDVYAGLFSFLFSVSVSFSFFFFLFADG
jgi:hypothetical protein